MVRRCVLVCFLLLAGTAVSGAAELPVKAAKLSVYDPSVYDPWSGFFAGAHGGFGRGQTKFFDNFPTPDGELDATAEPKGGLFGLQAGYNHRFGWLVLGLEGDFSWTTVSANFSCFPFGDQVCSASTDWVASITGRIGVADGPWLFYVKGGPAWMRESITDLATTGASRAGIPSLPGDQFYGNDTRFGWMVAPGIEYAFARRWSAWIEYDYYDFGSKSVPLSDGGTGFFTEEIHQKLNLVRAGINYHFDWDTPSGPGRSGTLLQQRLTGRLQIAFLPLPEAMSLKTAIAGGLAALLRRSNLSMSWVCGSISWVRAGPTNTPSPAGPSEAPTRAEMR